MSAHLRLATALSEVNVTAAPDPRDPGHVRLYDDEKLIGVYDWRDDGLQHFELAGRVRDFWPHSETQEHYLDRVLVLVGRYKS